MAKKTHCMCWSQPPQRQLPFLRSLLKYPVLSPMQYHITRQWCYINIARNPINERNSVITGYIHCVQSYYENKKQGDKQGFMLTGVALHHLGRLHLHPLGEQMECSSNCSAQHLRMTRQNGCICTMNNRLASRYAARVKT